MYFRDVLGHREKLAELERLLTSGRLPHALLLCGRAGVGKRTVALALAAAHLCSGRGGEACGSCSSCRGFAGANHPDYDRVQREPGKRDIGIAQVRELLERLHHKTFLGGGRAALIDDAERMTDEAQNAFLKTLEEPPPGALILLVSAAPERLLPTVRSRCAIHRFGPLPPEDLAAFARQRALPLADLPLGLAQGSPGLLLRLLDEGVRAASIELQRFVADRRERSPFELAARLARALAQGKDKEKDKEEDGDDEAPDDSRELARDRHVLAARLLACELRDLAALAAAGDQARLWRGQAAPERLAAARAAGVDRLLDALDLCERATYDLRGNMDPLLAWEDLARQVSPLLPAASNAAP